MAKFLDLAGLVSLWGKIKALIKNGEFSIKTKVGSTVTEVSDFTANLADADSITFELGTNITLTPDTTNKNITIAHATPSGASVLSTAVLKKLKWDAQGHIIGTANVANTDLPTPVLDGTFSVKTKVGTANATTVADFTANQSSADDVTFIQGDNITLTTDATNRTITIAAAAQITPNNATLTVAGDSGSNLAFSANESTNKTLTVAGGTNLNTAVTTGTNSVTVTVNHDTMTTSASPMSPASATATTYSAGNDLLSGFTLTHTNGHVTAITPTYKKINYATESTSGLMSADDKKTLNQINLTIANALTSAVTPKGSISSTDLVTAIGANDSILGSSHVGDLYQLSSPLVIGQSQSGDVTTAYSNFVEGASLTNNGTERYEFPAGTYIMVVNTGTALNPTYKLDAVSGLYNMSDYWGVNDLKPIPVDTSDEDYEAGDETIESICV